MAQELLNDERCITGAAAGASGPGSQRPAPDTTVSRGTLSLQFVTWLGTAAAGATLLAGIAGFLALGGRDELLGLPLAQDPQRFVTVGGLFFARSLLFVLASLLSGWMPWVALLIFTVLGRAIAGAYAETKWALAWMAMASLGIVAAEIGAIYWMIAVLETGTPYLAVQSENEYGVLALITLGIFVLLSDLEIRHRAGLGLVASGVSASWLYVRARVFTLGLAVVITFLVPRAYGVLALPRQFPTIAELQLKQIDRPATKVPQPPLLLLQRTDNALILFDPSQATIIELATDLVDWLRLGESQTVPARRSGTAR